MGSSPKKGLRTSEAIYNELQPGHQWPESMPLGPFGFKEAGLANAAAALKAWANNPFSDGGSFSLKKDTGVRVTMTVELLGSFLWCLYLQVITE